jgi:hypothetical protein
LKRKSTAIGFWFLNLTLEYLKRLQSSEPFMQKWIQPPAYPDHGLHRILSSYWLVHFYLMKKSAKVLLYFGLDCKMLEHGTVEKIGVCAHANHDPNKWEVGLVFAWSGSEL